MVPLVAEPPRQGPGLWSNHLVCSSFCRGLLYCMEFLEDNLDDWLGEELEVCDDRRTGFSVCWL